MVFNDSLLVGISVVFNDSSVVDISTVFNDSVVMGTSVVFNDSTVVGTSVVFNDSVVVGMEYPHDLYGSGIGGILYLILRTVTIKITIMCAIKIIIIKNINMINT